MLIPNPGIPFLSIWKHCYFRFIPPLSVPGGIAQKMDKFISPACEDLESLCREIGGGGGGLGNGGAMMAVIREEEGVSVDGDGPAVDGRGEHGNVPAHQDNFLTRLLTFS